MFSFHSCRIRLANSMSARSLSRSLLRRRRGGRRGRGSGERRLCRRRLHRPLPRRHRLLLPLLRGRVKHLAVRPRPPSVRSNDPAARRPFRAFRRPLSSLFINYWARSKTNSLARSPLLSNTATSDAGCEIYPGQIPAQCGGPAQCGASGPAGTAARHSLTG